MKMKNFDSCKKKYKEITPRSQGTKSCKGWKHSQRNQGCHGKSPFPRTVHDTCCFCVGL
jgi:hypothetical protein